MNNYRSGNYGYTDNQTWNNSLWAVDPMNEGGNGNYPVPPIAPDPNLPVWPGPGDEGVPVPPIEPGPDTNPPVWPGPDDENVPVPPIEPGPEPNPPVWPGPDDEGYPVPPIAPGPEPNPPVWPGPDEGYPVPPIAPGPELNPPVWPGPDEGYPVPPIAPGPEPTPPMIPIPAYAQVRFLNAAVNEGPFTITIAPRVIAGGLSFGNMTGYNRIADGYRTVTISNSKSPRNILFRQSIPFVAGSKVTMAIINVSNGIDVIAVPDVTCSNNNRNTGCFRVANLSYQSAPLDVLLNDGKVIFRDVTYKEVTNFKQARPGEYEFFVVNTPNYPVPLNNDMDIMANPAYYGGILVPITAFRVQMKRDRMYTAYIIGNDGFVPSLQVLVVENR